MALSKNISDSVDPSTAVNFPVPNLRLLPTAANELAVALDVLLNIKT